METSNVAPSLVIHVVHPILLFQLESGRLGIGELLTSMDTRFWMEIWYGPDEVMRLDEVMAPDQRLSELLKRHDITDAGWHVSVHPSPTLLPEPILLGKVLSKRDGHRWTVGSIGLLAGSTLRVTKGA
jgi:hypothetical protein